MTVTVTTENDTITLTSENDTITLTTKQWAARLSDIVAIALTNGNFIVADGTNWVAKTPAEVGALVGAAAVDYRQYTPVSGGDVPAHSEGLVFYDDEKDALSYYNSAADVTVNLGRELMELAKNTQGSAITNGQVVYVSGSSGDNPEVKLAKANSPTTVKGVMLVTTASINNNANGYCTTYGRVHDIDTDDWLAGDILYIDAATAGDMTNVKPTHPNSAVRVGWVVRKHASEGIVFVQPETDAHNFTEDRVLFANGDGEPSEDANFTWDPDTDTLNVGKIEAGTPETYTESNVSADRSYDANSTSLEEIADVLGTLIADLRTAGLID